MTVKSSISLTDAQATFARSLVEDGRYASLSAVLQQGLRLLEEDEDRRALLRAHLKEGADQAARGEFVAYDIEDVIARASE